MKITETRSQAPADATESLAESVLRALTGPRHAFRLREHVHNPTDLAAVRVLNTDALAPFALHEQPISAEDAEVIREAVLTYPPPEPTDHGSALLWRYRDWALGRLLRDLGGHDVPGTPEAPGGDSEISAPTAEFPTGQGWPAFTALLAQLSSLAMPGLRSPARDQARLRRQDLTRGMVRAMLRKDPPTAARLARWVALDLADEPEPLLAPALAHLEFYATTAPRARLELTIARLLEARK
ncbi:hypothetical protein [Actinokineospora iranica]|uniref:Uncharacterized protein n=1 Tax=Actinokineospora iranica TaxID=1271860 RepID=A0A1G6XBJ8_9PSEU|nr:hypothetical protein [Actinokineospora iranica]SDD75579.1 hypothetical protein SAMN05216174_11720 [Actinokineospora iranica]